MFVVRSANGLPLELAVLPLLDVLAIEVCADEGAGPQRWSPIADISICSPQFEHLIVGKKLAGRAPPAFRVAAKDMVAVRDSVSVIRAATFDLAFSQSCLDPARVPKPRGVKSIRARRCMSVQYPSAVCIQCKTLSMQRAGQESGKERTSERVNPPSGTDRRTSRREISMKHSPGRNGVRLDSTSVVSKRREGEVIRRALTSVVTVWTTIGVSASASRSR